MILAIVSGYFNPIHPGHISLIRDVKKRWPNCTLIAIVNNDEQVRIKGSVPFLDESTRRAIVQGIKGVDEAYVSIDCTSCVIETLGAIKNETGSDVEIFFCNGGDRNGWVPEASFCKDHNIQLEYGFGDDKTYASSELLESAAKWIKNRDFWRAFFDEILEELGIDPGKSASDSSI